ncbi:MAG: bifunctional [glutamate--ammonia ligase]-adenylyl-L-tyrosine phosphorylase/[glutamate--ammonia-ligase] adenylyltransferase [Pseudomonadales bacterium]
MATDDLLAQILTRSFEARLPAALQAKLEKATQKLLDRIPEAALLRIEAALQASPELAAQCSRTFSLSDYAVEVACSLPDDFATLLETGGILSSFDQARFEARLDARLARHESLDEVTVAAELRRFRGIEMLRLIWRDQNEICQLFDLTKELSYLADVCLQRALKFHYCALCKEWGTPRTAGGQEIELLVLGMGKLGAHELNLSSDIDLIFSYSEAGELDTEGAIEGAPKKSHQEFFIALGRRLIKAIDERTQDGIVFRVDMRLRPYGDSGALVHSFAALEDYYQAQGRDWERYAMIKARVVAGTESDTETLMQMLKPFVYRRYIDFSVFESLRSMKDMIVREVRRKGLQDNVKLGAGGIREVEFIAQVFQLVHGGRDKNLQQRELEKIYSVLKQRQLLPVDVVDELLESYVFLRNTEHALQAQRDQQTQLLPRDEGDQLRIAIAMGFNEWPDFLQELDDHRQKVRKHFSAVIDTPSADDESDEPRNTVWFDLIEEDIAEVANDEEGDGAHKLESLESLCASFKFSNKVTGLQPVARERLDKVMPELIEQLAQCDAPAEAAVRCLKVIDAILRRSAYLALLFENPLALKHLVQLCSNSIYITRKLVQHPLLLDELIDPRTLYQAPDRNELRSSLRQHMLRIELSDTEEQMEQLRYFKRSQTLRVAAAELSGALPLMKVSDYLTFIAECLLEYVLDLAWHDVSSKYGDPEGASADSKQFVVLAYGKLGGLELSHGSDLDLVFVYQADAGQMTQGAISVDSATFYTRLGQRIIHLLNTRTALGQVYEIDMRLRPSGNSGLLVSSTKGFLQYQNTSAWTWEHQALVRARAVTGDLKLMEWFNTTRVELLTQQRDPANLRKQVVEMRTKMREHLTEAVPKDRFHLKHSVGGIVDIEFMVQYGVLAQAATVPKVYEFTDNIRILDAFEKCAFLPAARAEQLRAAYIAFRACLHQLSLQDQEPIVDSENFESEIQAVRAAWAELLEE